MRKYEKLSDLVEIVEILRGENGCPWDKKQTRETLKYPFLEEAYEVIEAMELGKDQLEEELGDLLLHIIFQASISKEKKEFDICDIINNICTKLVRRHPHVFQEKNDISTEEVLANWEEIKKTEKNHLDRVSVLDGIPIALPALMKAEKIQKKAANVGFDWNDIQDVIKKVEEELSELKKAIVLEENNVNKEKSKEEIGDLIFSLVNLARFLKIDSTDALNKTIKKFDKRFRYIEKSCDIKNSTLEVMDKLWEESKNKE
ncbi:nucleoside triphosphate pyrophosphohydrolase [Fusobacterium sp. PH5-44]|uniref:nucleoside triphosphate pyrophosphohydrolase n=1 Tax=unclassified Fusobacterium TaxID=2648384 RepID=UPI003D2359E5